MMRDSDVSKGAQDADIGSGACADPLAERPQPGHHAGAAILAGDAFYLTLLAWTIAGDYESGPAPVPAIGADVGIDQQPNLLTNLSKGSAPQPITIDAGNAFGDISESILPELTIIASDAGIIDFSEISPKGSTLQSIAIDAGSQPLENSPKAGIGQQLISIALDPCINAADPSDDTDDRVVEHDDFSSSEWSMDLSRRIVPPSKPSHRALMDAVVKLALKRMQGRKRASW
jgi:hypothetical protein